VQQNLGAMVRSAVFLGAAGILAASKNCAPLSPAASKASAGCLEAFQMHDCDNLPRTLAQAATDGWCVVGASASSEAVPCSEIVVDRPTLLVLGSEGSGLRTNVKRVCEKFVKVPSVAGLDASVVDSLNVSVATGVLLHTMLTLGRSNSESWSRRSTS
jgi:21S rRNA (GM2251-2'-O)-methyltransferase